MSGLNPVHNYEYSVSLKLILSTQRFHFWGVTDDILRTTAQEEMMTEQQNLKEPNHQRSSAAHAEPSSHSTDVTDVCVN